MPHQDARRARARRPRAGSFVGTLALAASLLAVPGGPGPGSAAGAEPDRVATHPATLEPLGRVVVRTLARREAVGRSVTAPVPARLGWPRAGRWTRTVETSAEPATPGAGGASSRTDLGAAPTTPESSAIALETAAAGGPGVVGTAWDGLTDQAIDCGTSRPCLEPPDPWVAVSATHVLQVVNQSTRITSRTGEGAVTVSNRGFFGVSTWGPSAFAADPRVLYDPSHDRWIATLFAGTCTGGALFVAVSDTGDPAGTWQRYLRSFPGTWPDFPALGSSSALVAVGVNEFGVSCGAGGTSVMGAYQGASLHVMDWADLLDAAGPPTIESTEPDASAFSFVPAAGLTPGDAIHAVVALDDGTSSTADLGYAGVSGTIAGGDLAVTTPVRLSALPLAKLQQPPTPVDAGGLIGVQGNALDLRPTNAVWRDGRLAVATTAACLRGAAYRPCGRVVELVTQADLSAPTVRQDLRIAPTSGYTDTFVPGVGYSDDGTLWTVFSQGGTGRYVSSWARRQVVADAPGAWSPGAALVAAGRGPYGGTAGAGLNERWGDYVGVARDPAEPGSVWQANQLADTGGGWATRVARLGDDVAPPSLGAPRPSFVAGAQAGRTGISIRIAWSIADPGSGVATMRLERSVNGGTFTPVTLTSSAARSVSHTLTYGRRYQYRLTATDNAGNQATWALGPAFTPTLYTEGSSRVAYAGTWRVAGSSSYLGGRARYASAARHRATITLSGLAVAWVSTAARTRGSARVYADGVLQGTYSTYRSATTYRRVITGRTFPATGSHTFRIEVVGTARHPRVDVDSFVVLR